MLGILLQWTHVYAMIKVCTIVIGYFVWTSCVKPLCMRWSEPTYFDEKR